MGSRALPVATRRSSRSRKQTALRKGHVRTKSLSPVKLVIWDEVGMFGILGEKSEKGAEGAFTYAQRLCCPPWARWAEREERKTKAKGGMSRREEEGGARGGVSATRACTGPTTRHPWPAHVRPREGAIGRGGAKGIHIVAYVVR